MADDDQGIPTQDDYVNPPRKTRLSEMGDEAVNFGRNVVKALQTPGHVEGSPDTGEASPAQGKMRDYSNPPKRDSDSGLQAPSDQDSDAIADIFAGTPDPMQAYTQRKLAKSPQEMQQIDDANGGPKDPMTVYRSMAAMTDPLDQAGYVAATAKKVDTASAIARSLTAGEHGPPNYQGAANALNEAYRNTPDGNHIHVTSVGDNTVFNVSPVDESHNLKTYVVPNSQLATIAQASQFDNAMQGKLIPALENAQTQAQSLPQGYTRGVATVGARPAAGQQPAFSAPPQAQSPQPQAPQAQSPQPQAPAPQAQQPTHTQLDFPEAPQPQAAPPSQASEALGDQFNQATTNMSPQLRAKAWGSVRSAARSNIQNDIDAIQYNMRQNLNRLDNGQYNEHVLAGHNQSRTSGSHEVHNPSDYVTSNGKVTTLPGGASKSAWDNSSANSDQRVERGGQLRDPAQFHAVRQDIINQANDAINKRKQMLNHIDTNAKDSGGQPLMSLVKDPSSNTYRYEYNQNSPEGQKFHQALNSPWSTAVGGGSQAAITARTQAHDAQHQQDTYAKMINQTDRNGNPLIIRDASGNLALNPKAAAEGQSADRGQQRQPQYREGQTASDGQGNQIVFRNGQWQRQ